MCSRCLSDTCYLWLKNGHKKCYMGHRRFLEPNHEFRFDAESFDGFEEHREPPVPLSSHEISILTKDMKTTYGKLQQKSSRKRHRNQIDENDTNVQQDTSIFRKRSCFFQLPYWETLLLRHNLDPMHIEKNVFENIAHTLLNVSKRSKDNLNARLDLQQLKIRQDQHPDLTGSKPYLPLTLYYLDSHGAKMFCQVLKDARFPEGYASNLHNKGEYSMV